MISLIVYVLNSIALRDGLAILLYTDQLGQVYTYTYTRTKTYTYFTLKHTHILHLHIHTYMYTHIAPTDDLAIIMYDDQPGRTLTYTYTPVHIYAYIYMHMCIYTYTFIHTYTRSYDKYIHIILGALKRTRLFIGS